MEEVGYHRDASIRMNSIKRSSMFAHHQVAKVVIAALLACTRGTNVKKEVKRMYTIGMKEYITSYYLHVPGAEYACKHWMGMCSSILKNLTLLKTKISIFLTQE